MVKRLLFIAALLLPAALRAGGKEYTIQVSSQPDFDALSSRIVSLAKDGAERIDVTFKEGVYQYKENQVEIRNLMAPFLRVNLDCSGAVFVGGSEGKRSEYDAFVSLSSLSCQERLSAPVQVLARPSVVNRGNRICRVKTNEKNVPEREAQGLYLILTQWYRSGKYPVRRIQDGYIYFTCPDLASDGNPFHDPDSDYKFGRVLPRYSLLDARQTPAGCHRSSASRFLTLFGCYIGSFTLKGGTFIGNGGKDCLMQFYACDATLVEVSGCRFDSIHGDVIHVQRTGNFLFRDNVLEHLWMHGVTVDYFSPGAEIAGNRFRDTGVLMDQTFCLQLRGGSFSVHDNLFTDFTYGAIGIGTFYKERVPVSASGTVENNEMYCTAAFNRYLMDSGAVYTWTNNRRITLKNNYIHDIGGYGENRGIFCDDGTVNVSIIGNRVLRIKNSYCIDLRRVKRVEKEQGSYVRKANTGNRLEGNIVDGRIRFENDDR